jgi:hypothetical protein
MCTEVFMANLVCNVHRIVHDYYSTTGRHLKVACCSLFPTGAIVQNYISCMMQHHHFLHLLFIQRLTNNCQVSGLGINDQQNGLHEYQTNTDTYTHMSLYHHFINTMHSSSMFQTLEGHLQRVKSIHSSSVGQKNYITSCKIQMNV